MKSLSKEKTASGNKPSKKKQVLAIAALVLIALLYLATLIFAFLDHPLAKNCLMAALFCTIVVPVFVYVYIRMTQYLSTKGS